ncbi:hypothetical protein MASR2M79_16810 [Aminivibrio sp.]
MDDHDTGHSGGGHHAMMVADFRKRFWISIAATVPVLIMSPMIQSFFGMEGALAFTGDSYALWGISSFIFFYGGWPFLMGLYDELKKAEPGMMTLIAVAITTAYVYSSVVVFGLRGKMFFWELAILIDIMLLGHWIEMRSIMGASRALEEMAKLLPSDAHKLREDGSTEDVPIDEPALAQADVGIAVGAGTDAAVQTADIILVRSNPLDVVAILSLSKATYRKMIQNLAWATGYNAFAIPLAAGILYPWGILLSPAAGAVLMSLSTVIVAVNAKLLKMPGNRQTDTL